MTAHSDGVRRKRVRPGDSDRADGKADGEAELWPGARRTASAEGRGFHLPPRGKGRFNGLPPLSFSCFHLWSGRLARVLETGRGTRTTSLNSVENAPEREALTQWPSDTKDGLMDSFGGFAVAGSPDHIAGGWSTFAHRGGLI